MLSHLHFGLVGNPKIRFKEQFALHQFGFMAGFLDVFNDVLEDGTHRVGIDGIVAT